MTDLGLEWTKGPELLIGRHAHRSISIENQVYHFGGSGNLYEFLTFTLKIIRNPFRKTERWTIEENQITKELLDLELDNYSYFPELFAVNRNYCTFL